MNQEILELLTNAAINTKLPFKEAKDQWLELFERQYISEIYSENNQRIVKSAAQAGINRNHFSKLLDKYGLSKR